MYDSLVTLVYLFTFVCADLRSRLPHAHVPPLWRTIHSVCPCQPLDPDAHEGWGSLSSRAIFQRARQAVWRPHLRLARGSANSVCLRWRQLKLARGGNGSVCLRGRRYLHNAPTSPHTRTPTHPTPLNATTLHSHLLLNHTPAPHSHLCLGYK